MYWEDWVEVFRHVAFTRPWRFTFSCPFGGILVGLGIIVADGRFSCFFFRRVPLYNDGYGVMFSYRRFRGVVNRHLGALTR